MNSQKNENLKYGGTLCCLSPQRGNGQFKWQKFHFKDHKHDDTSQLLPIISYVFLQGTRVLLAQMTFYLQTGAGRPASLKQQPV